jgi:hypothetical protein
MESCVNSPTSRAQWQTGDVIGLLQLILLVVVITWLRKLRQIVPHCTKKASKFALGDTDN